MKLTILFFIFLLCSFVYGDNFTNKTEIKYFVSDQENNHVEIKPEIISVKDNEFIFKDTTFFLSLIVVILFIAGVTYFVHKNSARSN